MIYIPASSNTAVDMVTRGCCMSPTGIHIHIHIYIYIYVYIHI